MSQRERRLIQRAKLNSVILSEGDKMPTEAKGFGYAIVWGFLAMSGAILASVAFRLAFHTGICGS